jgi:hypothetical protein
MRTLIGAVLCASAVCVAGCSKPLLQVDEKTPSAEVTFRNSSSGYLQQFYFDDPVACKGVKSIDYSLKPYQSTVHRIPAERLITVWTSGFGLPADPGKVAWCRPSAFSAKLLPGLRYIVSFELDAEKRICGTVLQTDRGELVPRVERRVDGPEIGGGGPLAGSFSCNAEDNLSAL